MFFLSYLLFPFVILCPLLLWRKRIAWTFEIRILLGIVLLWLLYVAIVGGDFMEFRMIVPALPLIMVLVTMTLLGFTPRVRGRAALGALVVAGSLLHVATFERSPIRRGITPIRLLYANVSEPEWNFVQVGKRLGEAFRHDPKVMIATTAAGAIPYYSGLSAVDILGVNDSWIARNGRTEGRGSGHRRRASLPRRRPPLPLPGSPETVLQPEGPLEPRLPGAGYGRGAAIGGENRGNPDQRHVQAGDALPHGQPAGGRGDMAPWVEGRPHRALSE